MPEIKHTEAFDLAYRFVTETNLNIFLTGKAGTGKTTFLKYLREKSFKKMVVAAPTGVAAINAGGVTLHSLFQLPFTPFIPSKDANEQAVNSRSLLSKIHFHKEKLTLLRNLELLIIDEASMVACYTVDAIDTILRSIRRRHDEPFGGVQVLFIGDLYQLQPVVKNEEWQFLRDYYASIFFFDSLVLSEHVPIMIELKEIFRQKDDVFVDLLNEIRNNNLTPENLDLLNTRLNRSFTTTDHDGYITLTTHNYQSDKINKSKLQKLSARSQNYKATVSGDYPEHLYPAEAELELKEGAQVMFLKNDVEERKYFNGKIGVITKLTDDVLKVKCKDDAEEIVVKKYEWKNMNYTLNRDTHEITEEELGSFSQYPLRLAWAITIHKSQGLTFDKLVIDAENAFANGQVYVALSRCTSLEGLVLTSPINQRFLGAHISLKDWQKKNQDEKNLQQKFDESRLRYVQQELQNIFTWKTWYYELRELNGTLEELKDKLPAECLTWLKELTEKQKALDTTAGRFSGQIAQLCRENPLVEENEFLQKRIKDAANYFYDEITKWIEGFHQHSLTTDTKKTSKKIDALLEEINFMVHEILFKFSHCKNGFILAEYLKSGKKFNSAVRKIQSSYALNQKQNVSSKDSIHSVLYEKLADMRRELAEEMNLPLYRVFSNDAIKNVCINLPANKAALLEVKGFGKAKVAQYGTAVLELVRDYCTENNLEPQQIFTKSKKPEKKEKTPTMDITLELYKKGKSIEEIAKERNLAESTIEGHLAEAIKHGFIQIEQVMPMADVIKIAKYLPPDLNSVQLSIIKETFPEVISYGKIKMVLAWLNLEKGNEK